MVSTYIQQLGQVRPGCPLIVIPLDMSLALLYGQT
jgi:hypothetical protein